MKEKLLKIVSHDVERIERLITDYSQMLKDEASLSEKNEVSKCLLNDRGSCRGIQTKFVKSK